MQILNHTLELKFHVCFQGFSWGFAPEILIGGILIREIELLIQEWNVKGSEFTPGLSVDDKKQEIELVYD